MSDVWSDFDEINIEPDTWEDINRKIKINISKKQWVRTVTSIMDDCRPMGDCPYFGKIPTHVLIKCRKDKENAICSSNSRRFKHVRKNTRCQQECIFSSTS